MQLSPEGHWALVEQGSHEVEQTRSGKLHTSFPSHTRTDWIIGTQRKPPQSASTLQDAQLVHVLSNRGSLAPTDVTAENAGAGQATAGSATSGAAGASSPQTGTAAGMRRQTATTRCFTLTMFIPFLSPCRSVVSMHL